MACDVLWTERARADADAIATYIAQALASPQAAPEHLDAFEDAACRIGECPEGCAVSPRPSLAKQQLRTLFAKNCVMLYSYEGTRAIIWRIFRQTQSFARLISR